MTALEVLSTIRAMKRQEKRYVSKDYLKNWQFEIDHDQSKVAPGRFDPVNKECRFRMVGWCYQVVDFCKFSRDTVAIAMNYLDRFLSTTVGTSTTSDRRSFQLAVLACLYTAIKTHEPQALEPKAISDLSRGNYTELEVTEMEFKILTALRWHLNPPTPLSFTQLFLSIIPEKFMTEKERSIVLETAKYQTEVAVEDYSFVSYNPSCIALASIANGLKGRNNEKVYKLMLTLSNALGFDMYSESFILCKDTLWVALNKLSEHQRNQLNQDSSTVPKAIESTNAGTGSPRSIVNTSR